LVSSLSKDELEYVTRWLDHYQAIQSKDGMTNLGEVIGYLKEFKEQQDSGKSDYKLPPVPQ
jgi:hypothetical protein